MLTPKNARAKFNLARWNASLRKIPFEMTFEEWITIWMKSGHWYQRGRERGCYHMSRIRDCGPYRVGNVRIITREENRAEYAITPAHRAKLTAALIGNKRFEGRKHSIETRNKMSLKQKGRVLSEETKRKISNAKKGTLVGNENPMANPIVKCRWKEAMKQRYQQEKGL